MNDTRLQLQTAIEQVTAMPNQAWMLGAAHFQELRLAKGQFFVRQGAVCQQAAFVAKGLLRSFYPHEDGTETTTCFCAANTFSTAYRSFARQLSSEISIQAVEDSQLLVISHQALHELGTHSPEWLRLGAALVEKECLTLERYAAVLNRETATEKYQRLLREQPYVLQRVPVQQVASYLGISRETLSRVRRQVGAG